ncbi:ScbA/BarX family gamma-butyrolactone biosynthesis protein [Rhodococcus sp. G-MC3]|uniref:ScbA/BarX family gamma-butyrolactone biosynthesis protein n=1 Tax=Rhodococcus sp. G-MC3 TaxID=3046209 RepID=UPI0024B9E099|nr:ScbA/BarX family gamma-butyrolactone biosynthesis protein [Rhodococcus sp. G-MC3]MDJ0396703.1 ScbA/BarX family gamma-butyrolactone biosynthesis protein [Rhodococcus sp. G-MC3]
MEYTRTVPRQLVHRHAVAEVFLTDYSIGPGPAYDVAVQLPLSHRIFDASGDEHDPLGVAEAFRQTVVLLCHTSYDIPLHYRFLMEKFSVKMLGALRMHSTAAPLTFRLAVNDVTYRDGAASGVDVSGTLTDGTQDVARCSAVARGVSPEGYRRIRQGRDDQYPNQRTVPPGTVVIAAEQVGRTSDRDVLLSTDDARRRLFCTPDPHNHALFDHPVDHIPGMVIFEAARQALRYCSGQPAAQIAELSAIFPRFTEWETPCEVSTTLLDAAERGNNRYCVRFTQNQALTAELELSVVDAP